MPGNSKDVSSFKVVASLYQTLQGHNHAVLGASFSNDGHVIVSHDPCTIRVWKWHDQQQYVSHCVIETEATAIATSHDGCFIASIYEDRILGEKVRLWSSDGKWVTDLSSQHDACHMIFTPDDRQLAVVDHSGCVSLWDVTTWTLLCESDLPPNAIKTRLNNRIRFLAFAPDGQRLAIEWYTQNGAVQIYEIEEILHGGEIQWQISWSGAVAPAMVQAHSIVRGLSYSPDWQYLAVASDMECIVWIFDAFSLHLIGSFNLPRSIYGIADIAYSSDGTYLALAHGDGTVWVWDVAYQNPILTFSAHLGDIGPYSTVIGSIDWSPNDRLIMTTGVGLYKNWDADTEKSTLDKIDSSVKLWKIQKIPNPRIS
ncbi:WD40 repeat domain-containing protein [Dictyobacter formicarum]|nr:hypothetical protein [Dictyobacter formicarum]